jgi:DNA-directed RNA polymerase specialized sigma24 family protein
MLLDGGASQRPGHKILAQDLPPRIRKFDLAIAQLPEDMNTAIWLRYCAIRDEFGEEYTNHQRADIMQLKPSQYKQLLRDARRQLKKIIKKM